MRKYAQTFGLIFGASLFMSGANLVISANTGAPSIATYSVTHELTKLIVDALGDQATVIAVADENPEAPAAIMATKASAVSTTGS